MKPKKDFINGKNMITKPLTCSINALKRLSAWLTLDVFGGHAQSLEEVEGLLHAQATQIRRRASDGARLPLGQRRSLHR